VSLLRPDVLQAGLFPGEAWIKSRRMKDWCTAEQTPERDGLALLPMLDALLEKEAISLRKARRAVITVADSFGAMTAIPWQPTLTRASEVQAYARAWLEERGIQFDRDWVMHTEFSHHAAMGFVYALPRSWLEELLSLLGRHQLRLRRVLPFSAKAYTAGIPSRLKGKSLVTLQEPFRVSGLVFERARLIGYDTEPVIGDEAESVVRLLRRISAKQGKIERAFQWSSVSAPSAGSMEFWADHLNGAKVQAVDRTAWSVAR
jgi:hypothetical protein